MLYVSWKKKNSYQYLTCVFLVFGFQKKHGNTDMNEDLKDSSVPTISKRFKTVCLLVIQISFISISLEYKNNCLLLNFRFMGLRAAILTTCPDVGSFAANLGFSVLQISELIGQTPTSVEPPEVSDNLIRVLELLKLLGFSGGDVLEKYEFDLVILHIKPSDQLRDEKGSTVIKTDTDFLNKLVGGVMHAAQRGSKIACRLHFSIILGYGTVSDGDQNCSLILNSSAETSSDLLLLRPRQSYTMKSGNILTDIRYHKLLVLGSGLSCS